MSRRAVNIPVPQPINSPYPRGLLSGCVLALNADEGRAGVSRTNLVTQAASDPISLTGFTQRQVSLATGIPGFNGGIAFGDNSVLRYAYAPAIIPASTLVCLSVYVKMDDGGVPLPGTSSDATKDFGLIVAVAHPSAETVVDMGGGLYKVSATYTSGVAPAQSAGVAKYVKQSARGFKVTGYQLVIGAEALAYDNSPAVPAVLPPKLLDMTGLNAGAVLSGAVPVLGPAGVFYSFDAVDDYINAGKGASINNLAQMSFEMWAYRKSQGEGNQGRYFDKGGIVSASCATSATRVDFRRSFSTTNGYWYSDTTIQTGKWQHIVITYDNSSANNNPLFYIDGVLVATTRNTQPVGTPSSDSAADLYIGNKADTNGTWDGYISQPRLYNRILNAFEVQQLRRESAWHVGMMG